LLPPSVRDVLSRPFVLFVRLVAKLNLGGFRDEYGTEGGPLRAGDVGFVWLYAYALE